MKKTSANDNHHPPQAVFQLPGVSGFGGVLFETQNTPF
jgi:hypothetical protein